MFGEIDEHVIILRFIRTTSLLVEIFLVIFENDKNLNIFFTYISLHYFGLGTCIKVAAAEAALTFEPGTYIYTTIRRRLLMEGAAFMEIVIWRLDCVYGD
ncbi:hypothetical protein ACJX0J_035291 [Zea mays]